MINEELQTSGIMLQSIGTMVIYMIPELKQKMQERKEHEIKVQKLLMQKIEEI